MSDLDQLQDQLYTLSELRARIATAKEELNLLHEKFLAADEAHLSEITRHYEELRDQVLFEMQLNKLESMKNDKVTVSITHRPSFAITDENEAVQWLKDNEFDLTEFMTLDKSRLQTTAEARLKETGEIIPGTAREIKETISIRDRK